MKKLLIAFDVDGTLRKNTIADEVVANEDIRTLLIILSKFKNTTILVWSGGGELYARQVVAELGLKKYVDRYADKQYVACEEPGCRTGGMLCDHHVFATDIRPDIAIDDIQAFELGHFNLICREK